MVINRCQFVDQPCFKVSNSCLVLLQEEIELMVKEYRNTEERAKEVAIYNLTLLAPNCMWRQDYHYPFPNLDKPRNKCKCGKEAWVWDGVESLCFECYDGKRNMEVINNATKDRVG